MNDIIDTCNERISFVNIIIPGGHDVVEVKSFDEWLYLGSLLNFLLTHRTNYFSRVSLNTGNCSTNNQSKSDKQSKQQFR